MTEVVLALPTLEATDALAGRLAETLLPHDCLALAGDLGTGKTTLARALLRALGVKGAVPSPTFTLLETYQTPLALVHHIDLYRLKAEAELDELGWDEVLSEGIALIEWPERAGQQLPHDRLQLFFELKGKERQCRITPHGSWSSRLNKVLDESRR